jgi:hypothetical protein
MLTDPRTILSTVKTVIEAIELPESYGDGVKAFQEVKIYDLEDLLKAIEELLTFKDRVAIMVMDNAQHDTEILGRQLTAKRTIELTVLLADRHWGNRQIALLGSSPEGPQETPGAIQLSHLLINGITGEQSGGIIVQPGFGEIFALEGKTRDNATGRIAWRQEFTIAAGRLLKTLSRAAD